MSLKESKLPVLTLLAIVFTVALTFAALELPAILNSILRVYFPGIYWEPESIEALMNYARPIGYACLVVVPRVRLWCVWELKSLANQPTFG